LLARKKKCEEYKTAWDQEQATCSDYKQGRKDETRETYTSLLGKIVGVSDILSIERNERFAALGNSGN
jgi:hypothetical protein